MKKLIEQYFTVIVLVVMLLTFVKGCSDSREITKVRKEIQSIKDSTYTKTQLDLIIRIEGLRAENRAIQASDRKIMDVNRQKENDDKIRALESLKTKW